jgi:NAD(P)-dependent dehydrogenase (short-subunit alcohol dehydrogenase family)
VSIAAVSRLRDLVPIPASIAIMSTSLKGKVALVTGGGKNLGGLISRQLAQAGATVAIHFNSPDSKKSAVETSLEIEKNGGKAAFFQADMTKPIGLSPHNN